MNEFDMLAANECQVHSSQTADKFTDIQNWIAIALQFISLSLMVPSLALIYWFKELRLHPY